MHQRTRWFPTFDEDPIGWVCVGAVILKWGAIWALGGFQ